jgi:hypothetical protein
MSGAFVPISYRVPDGRNLSREPFDLLLFSLEIFGGLSFKEVLYNFLNFPAFFPDLFPFADFPARQGRNCISADKSRPPVILSSVRPVGQGQIGPKYGAILTNARHALVLSNILEANSRER